MNDTDGEAGGLGHNSGDYDDDVDVSALSELPTDEKLTRLRDLAKLQVQREKRVDDLEAALKIAQAKLAEVANRDLPALLSDLGFKKVPLINGAVVELKTKVVGSVKEADRQEFFTWLHKIGSGSIVKRKVSAEFPRGASKKAGLLLGYLKRWYKDYIVTDAESVHAGTLNAWVREFEEKNTEALRAGGKVVERPDFLTVTELKESVVTLPKGKEVDWS